MARMSKVLVSVGDILVGDHIQAYPDYHVHIICASCRSRAASYVVLKPLSQRFQTTV